MSVSSLQCPFCGSFVSVHRLGRYGVPSSRYGWRSLREYSGKRIRDVDRFKCDGCGAVFRAKGAVTMLEEWGAGDREAETAY